MSRSVAIAASNDWSAADHAMRRIIASDFVGPAASARASSSADGITCSSGTSRLIMPHASAFAAGMRSPSSIISIARARPMLRASNQLDPPSGTSPIRANACRKNALSPHTTMSAASAKEQPTPAADPFTAETHGNGASRRRSIRGLMWLSRTLPESYGPSLLRSPMPADRFAPEQNARPAPVSTMARAEPLIASSAAPISSMVLSVTAFSVAGSLSRMIATSPSRASSIVV